MERCDLSVVMCTTPQLRLFSPHHPVRPRVNSHHFVPSIHDCCPGRCSEPWESRGTGVDLSLQEILAVLAHLGAIGSYSPLCSYTSLPHPPPASALRCIMPGRPSHLVKQGHMYMLKGSPCLAGPCRGRSSGDKQEPSLLPVLTFCLMQGSLSRLPVLCRALTPDLLCFGSSWTTGQSSANGG